MDRREILVLKPDAVICRMRKIDFQGVYLWLEVYPTLNKRSLCRPFLTSTKAINYAIAVKHRYLKLKEYECMNPPTT